jgi:O-antigen ligase
MWLSLGAGIAIVLVLLQSLGGSIGARFDQSGLSDPGRLETYRSLINMITDHPWLGTGLGTFVWAFPPYRESASIWGTWTRAHDTPLEIASDMGLPFLVVVTAAWIALVLKLVQGIRVRRRDVFVPIAALTVALVSLLHSVLDFSLQIPGHAIVVFALIGAGLVQSYPRRRSDLG